MTKHILFIQGGSGEEDYTADAKLVASLKKELGKNYVVHYPLLDNDGTPDFGRLKQIDKEISLLESEIILVGHSLGASMLLKYLSEVAVHQKIIGVFLMATPFWRGDEDWKQGLKLQSDFANKLPKEIPIFLYHSEDDEVVPVDHLEIYKQHLPHSTICKMPMGGHQFNNDLSRVGKDIKILS